MAPFESLDTVSYSPSIVSCIISEIKRYIGRKSQYPLHSTPVRGGPRQNIAVPFGAGKLEWCGYPGWWKEFEDMFSRLDRIPACDRQTRHTDRRTSCHTMHTCRAVKICCSVQHCRISFTWCDCEETSNFWAASVAAWLTNTLTKAENAFTYLPVMSCDPFDPWPVTRWPIVGSAFYSYRKLWFLLHCEWLIWL